MRLRCLLLIAFIFLLTLQTFAQVKPQALKFDEFGGVFEEPFYSKSSVSAFKTRVERFSKQLEKERGATAYIIYYQARITYTGYGGREIFVNEVNGIKNRIIYNDRIKVKDVVIIDGGYRENNSVEMWIVPENAELPAPTPTFNKSETYVCRSISVSNDTAPRETETVRFTIYADNFKGMDDYSVTWKVSAGEIVSGQGTTFIEVKLNDSNVKRVTAYAEVSGLPFPCPKVFSVTAEISANLYMFDSYGIAANGETKGRLDSFLSSIFKNLTAKAYIIVYGSRDSKGRDGARAIALIRSHLAFRKFDTSRITIINGGFREEVSTEYWLSFDDAQKPPITPTVDEKFVVIPKPAAKPRSRRR